MMTKRKSLLPSSKRPTITFNKEYNNWKEKQIERKRKEESKFIKLDETSELFNTEFLKKSDLVSNSRDKETENQKPQVDLPGVGATNEGSSSFVGGQTSNFYLPSAPNKNTTYELPKANNSG